VDWLLSVFDYISDLGATFLLPLIILIVGLIFRLRFSQALRAGVTVGIGFVGLNLVLNLIWNYIGPVTTILVERFQLNLNTVDAGWAAAAGVAFATRVGAVIIPFIILVNLVMLLLRQTRTVNIDIWNFWHFAFSGAVIMTLTGSFWYGLLGAAAHCVIALKFADVSAERVQKEIGLPGISIAQGFAITTVPIYLLLEKVYDKIPGMNRKKFDSAFIQNKLSFVGEPIMIGLILGILLGVSVGYGLKQIGELGVAMAALMMLLPRMVKVIMEGLIPISDAAKTFLEKRFKGSEFYIGLDSAVLLGHTNTITVAILLIPITLGLAFLLPGNTTLPIGDLAATAFFVAMATPIHRGDFLRTLISGTIMMGIVLLIASYFAPIITDTARETGFTFPEGATNISALSAGNLLAFIFALSAKLKYAGIAVIVIVSAAVLYFFRKGVGVSTEAGRSSSTNNM
jgi:PTS system galactitol-specific IIC component